MDDQDFETIDQILQVYRSAGDEFNSKRIEGIEFNSFSLIHSIFGISETKHTKLLAFFLDPEAFHGQETLFLGKFLEKIEGLELYGAIEKYNWKVTTEDQYADIVIKATSPERISIVIENKSNGAQDQAHQLYRYWYDHIYCFFERDLEKAQDRSKCRMIYLTDGYSDKKVSENSMEKPDFIKLGYQKLDREKGFLTDWTYFEDIKNWLRTCISEDSLKEKHRLKFYIEDYLQFWDNTRFKDDFFMERLKNEFSHDEQKWNTFIGLCQYKDKLTVELLNGFIEKLKSLVQGSNWKFDKEGSNDFRFYFNNWGDTSLVYEWHIGLTIWKAGGDKIKEIYKDRLQEHLQSHFQFTDNGVYNNRSYMMEYNGSNRLKFSTYEEFLWKANYEPAIVDTIAEVFNALKNKEIEDLFNEMDHHVPAQ